jgi:tripartite ATP-independent transporter DctM subunit
MATVMGATGFKAICGSSAATSATFASVAIPEMNRYGYDIRLSTGIVATVGTLGVIIPPSVTLIILGIITEQSIGQLFLAGIVPGLLFAAGFFVICSIMAARRNYPRYERVGFKGRVKATGRASWALMMPIMILVGIRFGVFTEMEVAAAAGIYALIVSLFIYRGLKVGELPRILWESGRTSAAILFLLAAAGPFSWLVAESQVSVVVVNGIKSISDNPVVILLVINALLLVVGSILEPLPAMVIFLPALIPIGQQLGIDPIHFGAVVVVNLMIGLLHPPVGLLLFVVSSVGNCKITKVAWEALPFLAWSLIVLVLIIVFPALTTWLPGRA